MRCRSRRPRCGMRDRWSRAMPSGRRSRSDAMRLPRSPRPGCWVETCASASRTRSISRRANWRPAMRHSSQRRAVSSRTWGACWRRRCRRASAGACATPMRRSRFLSGAPPKPLPTETKPQEFIIMKTRPRALRLSAKAASPETLSPELVDIDMPTPLEGNAVIEVLAAAVNPSDVKAALGMMPHAIWPRTPGRDFAGRVVAGPAAWLGQEVWGTGGELGITRDGSHSRYLVLPLDALARKPASVSIAAAGTVGVPFITAHEGLRRAGLKGSGQTVVVFGAN